MKVNQLLARAEYDSVGKLYPVSRTYMTLELDACMFLFFVHNVGEVSRNHSRNLSGNRKEFSGRKSVGESSSGAADLRFSPVKERRGKGTQKLSSLKWGINLNNLQPCSTSSSVWDAIGNSYPVPFKLSLACFLLRLHVSVMTSCMTLASHFSSMYSKSGDSFLWSDVLSCL